MAVVLKELYRNFHKWMYVEVDERATEWPLMTSPVTIILLVTLYVQFATKWGPAFMKNRKPFKVDKIIQIYNVIQVVLCLYITIQGIWYLYGPWGNFNFWCEPVDYTVNPLSQRVLRTSYIYFILKVVDLLDTVFFVLRKKNSQISFLHVYHHAGMVAGTWVAFRHVAGGSSIFVGFLNSAVHAVMYSYYFITSYNPTLRENLWWKKYITQIQIAQFFMFSVHSIQLLLFQSCGFPKLPVILFLPQNLFMFSMFLDFYRKAYLTPRKENKSR